MLQIFFFKPGRVDFWYAVDTDLELGSSIQKHAGSRSTAPVGGAGGQSPPQKKKLRKKILYGNTAIGHCLHRPRRLYWREATKIELNSVLLMTDII